MAPKPRVALGLTLLLTGGACSSSSPEPTAGQPRPAGSPSTTVGGVVEPVPGCTDLGPVPAGGEVTWTRDGRLFAAAPGGPARCLLAVPHGAEGPAWGAGADRVLLDPGGVRLDGRTTAFPEIDGTAQWSRPVGTSLLLADKGTLRKVPVGGGEARDVTFLRRHDEATYHPGGRYLYSVGEDLNGRYGLFFATNGGERPAAVAVAESATELHSLAFSGDALVFAAVHPDNPPGDRVHLHWRTQDPLPPLFTAAVGDDARRLITSPVDFLAVAVEAGPCGRRRVSAGDPIDGDTEPDFRFAAEFRPLDVDAPDTEAVGWLPGRRLVVIARERCTGPGALWVVPVGVPGPPVLVANEVESAGVRVVIPPGVAEPVEATGDAPVVA